MNEDHLDIPLKKRRLQGACDECKKRKIKCDSASMPGNVCSNCLAFRTKCTRVMAAAKKKRGPPAGTPRGQKTVPVLVKAILSTTKPYVIPEDPDQLRQILTSLASRIVSLEEQLSQAERDADDSSAGQKSPSMMDAYYTPAVLPHDDDEALPIVREEEVIKHVKIDHAHTRHFGLSSTLNLVVSALDAKVDKDVVEDRDGSSSGKRKSVPVTVGIQRPVAKRHEFWGVHSWQIPIEDPFTQYVFPPEDLMHDLIDLYFTHVNPFFPILHRGIFERSVAESLHHWDRCFAAVVLAIAVYFVNGTSTPEASWVLLGLGVRYAQDLGIHRKLPGDAKPTVESQLQNRAFWGLIAIDVVMSVFLGRPRATHTDDFDLPLPIECDDEFWGTEDPEMAFKQPPGKPCTMSFWVSFLKLLDIVGFAQRTIYAVRKTDMWTRMGISGPEWTKKIVAELDSALNAWVDTIPDHLKWNPSNSQTHTQLFFHQSTMLYMTYYWVQLLVHKPFLGLSQEDVGFPSMTICTNAARLAVHLAEVHQRRTGAGSSGGHVWMFPTVMIVLYVNTGKGEKTSDTVGDVRKCIRILRRYEITSQVAGRFCDILNDLFSTDTTADEVLTTNLRRRGRPDEEDEGEEEEEGPPVPSESLARPTSLRPIASSSRVSGELYLEQGGDTDVGAAPELQSHQPFQSQSQFTLPISTAELGSSDFNFPFHETNTTPGLGYSSQLEYDQSQLPQQQQHTYYDPYFYTDADMTQFSGFAGSASASGVDIDGGVGVEGQYDYYNSRFMADALATSFAGVGTGVGTAGMGYPPYSGAESGYVSVIGTCGPGVYRILRIDRGRNGTRTWARRAPDSGNWELDLRKLLFSTDVVIAYSRS
ncbi:Gypsy retrotransposon integrase-like protein 1 [Marasmius crinis-equi]|uniref:Gypsy retrotransposon integrase-like protein 1 n=1 Tax=Marasmius crinis-equi TaxID=585013 RepID=A0ABR3FHN2_9AGAR